MTTFENPCGPYDGEPWPTLSPPAGWDVVPSGDVGDQTWVARAWLWVPEELDFTGLWTCASYGRRTLPQAGKCAIELARELEAERDAALEDGAVARTREWKRWAAELRRVNPDPYGLRRTSHAVITGLSG